MTEKQREKDENMKADTQTMRQKKKKHKNKETNRRTVEQAQTKLEKGGGRKEQEINKLNILLD